MPLSSGQPAIHTLSLIATRLPANRPVAWPLMRPFAAHARCGLSPVAGSTAGSRGYRATSSKGSAWGREAICATFARCAATKRAYAGASSADSVMCIVAASAVTSST